MVAMMEVDGEAAPIEREILAVTLPYPNEIRRAKAFLLSRGLSQLLSLLSNILNHQQQRCLMANLISMSMADGVIHTCEQALLDRFKQALSFVEADYTALYDVLLTRDNLAILAA